VGFLKDRYTRIFIFGTTSEITFKELKRYRIDMIKREEENIF